MESTDAYICGSWYYELQERTGKIRKRRTVTNDTNIKALLTIYNPICNPTTFFKKSILRNPPYREDYRYAEDSEMWLELATRAKFTIVPDYLIYYRVHDMQMSKETTNAPSEWFNKARDEYLSRLLGTPTTIKQNHFKWRLTHGTHILCELNKRLTGISFRVNCELYSRMQPKHPRMFSVLRRLERIVIVLIISCARHSKG